MNKIETALILSAGYGTRAKPLSLIKPKPLFPVLNKSMLEWWIEKLYLMGVKNIIINVHYLAEQIEDLIHSYLSKKFSSGLNFYIFKEEGTPLGSAATIKNLSQLHNNNKIGDNFYAINSDIFTDLNFTKLTEEHFSKPQSLATLALLDYETIANVALGEIGQILAFRKNNKVSGEVFKRAYSGIMILRSQILDLLPETASDIIEYFNIFLESGHFLNSYLSTPSIWSDIGTVNSYWQLNKNLAENKQIIASTAIVETNIISGFLVVGANSHIHKNVNISNSVIWPNAEIEEGAIIQNSVIHGKVPKNTVLNNEAWVN